VGVEKGWRGLFGEIGSFCNNHQMMTAVHRTAADNVMRKPRKKRWLASPTHVSSHGQWWSYRRTHRPQSSQWRARSGCCTHVKIHLPPTC